MILVLLLVSQISKMRIIIDTDAGLDDAQAILMALCQSHVEVVAITTVHGNTDAPQVALNVLRLLRLVDRLDVSYLLSWYHIIYIGLI